MSEASPLDNAAWARGGARLSVLIPFKGDDPTALIAALSDPAPAGVELVVLDDGTGDEALAERVWRAVQACRRPARFVRLAANEGRAKGRNRLAGQARSGRLLFLDSDMAPDRPDFLQAWLALIDAQDPPVAFGGFSLDQTPSRPEHALHRAMALKSDCLSAKVRAANPEKHVFTSNLLVRSDVFAAVRFDERFAGWGWEDVEWAMRVARRWPILHVDIPASHLGLDTAAVLAAKYAQSAANFALVAAEHPDIVAAYPSYRVAKAMKPLPLRESWRGLFKMAACAEKAPLPLRALAMRLFRAALYAEVV